LAIFLGIFMNTGNQVTFLPILEVDNQIMPKAVKLLVNFISTFNQETKKR